MENTNSTLNALQLAFADMADAFRTAMNELIAQSDAQKDELVALRARIADTVAAQDALNAMGTLIGKSMCETANRSTAITERVRLAFKGLDGAMPEGSFADSAVE